MKTRTRIRGLDMFDETQPPSLQTMIVYAEDRPGVLDRVASVFRRRSFNIASISVGRSETEGLSRMTIVMEGDPAQAHRAVTNLRKIVHVRRVLDLSRQAKVDRSLALVKIESNPATRSQILELAEIFRVRVIDVGRESLILEATGSPSKIDGLIDVLRPFGILEISTAGVLSMNRCAGQETELMSAGVAVGGGSLSEARA